MWQFTEDSVSTDFRSRGENSVSGSALLPVMKQTHGNATADVAALEVLIIHRDSSWKQIIAGSFAYFSGCALHFVDNYDEAERWLRAKTRFERLLVVLDIEKDGDAYNLSSLRRFSAMLPTAAIIVVTECQDPEIRLAALEECADACLSVSTDLRELIATIRCVSRRFGLASSAPKVWTLAHRENMLVAPGGEKIRLNFSETMLIALLCRNVGKPVSRKKIGEELGDIYRYSGNALEAMISRLRRKIRTYVPEVEFIRAVNGCGYVLAVEMG